MNDESISTLIELLEKYQVEIPIVQRDYAQGRLDERTTRVRINLLSDMKEAIVQSQKLDLSFIYGKDEDGKFIPMDGQQRLTTLFLLHLYAFRNDETKTELLHRFTYETRISSRDFLNMLINNRDSVFIDGNNPSSEITDSEWFISSWKNDPTVQSVLVVLDDIVKVFSDVINLSEKLENEDNPILTFHFLEMKDLGMEDDLYIKLNARGKPLTNLENFKALLIARMNELNIEYINQFEQNFDGIWTDYFWEKSAYCFDEFFYSFFGMLLMNDSIIERDINWENSIDYSTIPRETFDCIFYTLNYFSSINDKDFLDKIVDNILYSKRSLSNRVLFYVVTKYLYKHKGKIEESFKQWFRIMKNLILNSTIDEIQRYRNAIYSVSVLSNHMEDILSFFAEKNNVIFFDQNQIEEEQIKAKIIIEDSAFANAIYEAEKHPYFSGQICSALNLSKIDEKKYNLETFQKYWNKISELFDETKPKFGKQNLLRRALLTLGNYTLSVGNYRTLCVDDPNESASTPSLKKLFSRTSNIDSKYNVVKKLLDAINIKEDIESQLERLIEKSEVPENDWRYCFIHYPELFNLMSTSHLRIREENGVMSIIPNKSSNGNNYNLYLATLREELINRGISRNKMRFDEKFGINVTHILYIKEYEIIYNREKFYIVKNSSEDIYEDVFESSTDNLISETADFMILGTPSKIIVK